MKFSPLVTASAGVVFLTLSAASSWAKMNTVIVAPGIPGGWASSTGSPRFDVTAAPMGAGALVLGLTETQQPEALSAASFAGVWLRDLYSLQYTVRRTAPAGGTAAPVIELDVDFDLRDRSAAPQGKLVYNPALNGTVTTGAWQTWNASGGKWYLTGGTAAVAANASAGQPFPQSAPATLREILTRFPNAGIRAAGGIVAGGTVAGGTLSLKAGAEAGPFTAAIDSLTITLKGGGTTWNFEPDSDGDRIPDFIDRVPLSDLRTKVEMGFGPTTVNNTVDKSGMSIQDKVLAAMLTSGTPAKYMTAISVLAMELQKAGAVTPRQKDELKSAAGTFASAVATGGTSGGGTVAGGTLSLGGGSTGATITNKGNLGGIDVLGSGLVQNNTGTLVVNSGTQLSGSATQFSGVQNVNAVVVRSNSHDAGAAMSWASEISQGVVNNNNSRVRRESTGTAGGALTLENWLTGRGTGLQVLTGGTSQSAGTLTVGGIPGGSNALIPGDETQSLVNTGTGVVNSSDPNPGNVNVNNGGALVMVVRPNNGQPVANTGTAVGNPSVLNGNLIAATGGLTLTGSGTILNTAGTFTGVTTVNGGVINLSNSGSSIGNITANSGTLVIDTRNAAAPLIISADFTIAAGSGIVIRGSVPVKFTGTITNYGTIRTERGATLDASTAAGIVNNGTIDRISGTMLLPATLTHGPAARLLDAAAVQVRTAVHEGNSFTLTIDGHTGHTYQLQRTNSLDQPFTNTGTPQTGAGAVLTFTSDDASAPRGFYRVAVDP